LLLLNDLKTKIHILIVVLTLVLPVAARAQFTYITNADNTITITGYTGGSGTVVIPAATNGYPVVSIGTNAFSNKSYVTSVTIPNSLINIGSNAFYFCSGLTSVTIPDSVISIGGQAFYSCSHLTNVSIGASVTSIGVEAFEGSDLMSVTIPESVTNIGIFAFVVSRLTNISIAAGNSAYSSANGVLFDEGQTTLIQYPGAKGGNYNIPNSVTSIEQDAFSGCSNLPSVTIPNSVTSMGSGVFGGCSGLTNVIIGNGVTNINNVMFSNCSRLRSITIPNSVTSIGDGAFLECTSLTNITCLGNAPTLTGRFDAWFNGVGASARVYYYYGTSGWGTSYGYLPTVMLYFPPQIGGSGGNVQLQAGKFGFTLTGVSNQTVVLEASTNLVNWLPVWTNTLSGASTNFTDSKWTNYPRRFYRAR
jgi:hypothetical protein